MDEKADVTLAPNVRHAGMDFRRDTGVYSLDGLSTPADFQRSREYQSPILIKQQAWRIPAGIRAVARPAGASAGAGRGGGVARDSGRQPFC